MTVLLLVLGSIVVLVLGGRFYSRFLARSIGEDPTRKTPATTKNDGADYVPTPTPVVFAHHFASIAGAGPILGPVIAIVYGWLPAVLWVLFGGVLIGAVHDYLATYIATREGGQSVATITRRLVGKDAFVAMTFFIIILLGLVCAAFLNASAIALTSMLPFDRLDLPETQTIFRVVKDAGAQTGKVVIGGIASMSVVCITAVAPLLGWMYIKKKIAVWKCSLLAIAVCAVSILIGVLRPITLEPLYWKFALSAYVLIAAGVPVWIFLQSRDFINVHILYVGMGALLVTLVVAGIRGGSVEGGIPAVNISEGTKAMGFFWPTLFSVIACGAVSGFHSLCAGGTTSKQLTSERAARQIGYYGMLLESFLAVCVIGVMIIGAEKLYYLSDVHPGYLARAYPDFFASLGLKSIPKANWILGFAMAVGNAVKQAFGVPIVVGALAGLILLEGFLVTTLDTAIRLTRYLIEEIWRVFFGRYDVFAEPVAAGEQQKGRGDEPPVQAGVDGLPAFPSAADDAPAPASPIATSGAIRWLLTLLRMYWVNSGLAVALMLAFALTGAQDALWKIFATSNQLLAALVLSLAALWLLRQKRRVWFAFIPGVIMLVTTCTNLVLLLCKYLENVKANITLMTADIILMILTAYLLVAGVRAAVRFFRQGAD